MSHFQPDVALNFDSVPRLRKQIEQLVKSAEDMFEFDLSKIHDCDSAGLALLLATRQSCVQHHKSFKLSHIPEKTRALAHFCGVEQLLVEGLHSAVK